MIIILVFDPSRSDLFRYFEKDNKNEYLILYREFPNSNIQLPAFIKKELFWRDYKNPFELLRSEKPDKIIFQEVFDIKQIALNIAAKNKGIETIYVDHGLSTDFDELLEIDKTLQSQWRKSKIKKLKNIVQVLKNYWFYFSVFNKVKVKNKSKFLLFCWYSFRFSTGVANDKIKYEERKPDRFILFNQHNFKAINRLYGCREDQVTLTGFPFFDTYYNKTELAEENYIVFIDHPNYEERFYGWDEEFHKKLATGLYEFARTNSYKVIVKLHPRSDINLWNSYKFDQQYLQVVQKTQEQGFYLKAKLIIGYSSTLMVGFISAKKNVVLVGWHPKPAIQGLDFSVFNVCHKSLNISDLITEAPKWIQNNLTVLNDSNYIKFIQTYNYPFDGNASGRILKAIGV